MKKKEFVDKFWENFIESISIDIRKKFKIEKKENKFLWDVFAAHLTPCLEGEAANSEYDKVNKEGAIEIQYNFFGDGDLETQSLKKEHLTSKSINRIPEFYVIGKDFSWCYIVTHELSLCGPFFSYKTKNNVIQ